MRERRSVNDVCMDKYGEGVLHNVECQEKRDVMIVLCCYITSSWAQPHLVLGFRGLKGAQAYHAAHVLSTSRYR